MKRTDFAYLAALIVCGLTFAAGCAPTAETGGAASAVAMAAPSPAAPAAAQRQDKWIVIGPGGGGSQYDATISPHDPKTVFAHCDMTGAYISRDGGDSWRMFNLRDVASFFVFDPVDPNVVYAYASVLWRSTDGGKTWETVFPDPSRIKSVGMPDDHAGDVVITTDGSDEEVRALAVDPADSKTLYAVFSTKGKERLVISADWGKTWKDELELAGGARAIYVDSRSPKEDRTICVTVRNATVVREGGKWTSNPAPTDVTSFSSVSAGFPKDGGKLIVYGIVAPSYRGGGMGGRPGILTDAALTGATPGGARAGVGTSTDAALVGAGAGAGRGEMRGGAGVSTDAMLAGAGRGGAGSAAASGIYVSTDGGATWNNVISSLVGKAQTAAAAPAAAAPGVGPQRARPPRTGPIAACLTEGNVAVVNCSGIPTGKEGEAPFSGIARTEDCGATWELLFDNTPKKIFPSEERLPWFYELYSPGGGAGFTTMTVAPTDSRIVYGTDLGRTMRSTDGGRTWQECYTKIEADGTVTTRGLDVTTCYGVHFDPFDPKRIFISYTDIGAFMSEDGGATWAIGTTNVPREWRNTTYWMEFDPAVKGHVWGVFVGPHDLPRPKMWRRRSDLKFSGGVCISNDGGRTWQQSTEGMPESGGCTHIIMDPASPVDARVLYVAGMGNGVFKSADGGKSWTLKKDGIEGDRPLCWRLARDAKGTLYAVVARRTEDGSYGNDGDGALYRSTDGAEHWEKIALPDGVNGPNGIAVDPEDANRLYLACWGRNGGTVALDGGILLSADGGKTWKNVLPKDQHVYDITIDASNPRILYACGFESTAWRSTDRGETWTRIKGYNFKWGHRVILDPHHAGKIFVTTFGGSVWYGPAEGDANAPEDIATPEMGYAK